MPDPGPPSSGRAAKWTFIVLQAIALAIVIGSEMSMGRDARATCSLGALDFLAAAIAFTSAFFTFGFMPRGWRRRGTIAAVMIEAVALFLVPIEIHRTYRDTLVIQDPTRSVADARNLIRSSGPEQIIALNEIPASLRIPQVMFVQAHGDHLDLITLRNPDGHSGFRIWLEDAKTIRKERPTSYRDISFYSWNNDFPKSPDNMP